MPTPPGAHPTGSGRTIAPLLAAAAMFLHGCAPVYYPNISHAPLFSSAGEIHASANLTTDGYELMSAASPVEHLGVIGSYAWGKEISEYEIPPNDHRYGELGLCYYTTLGQTRPQRIEVFGGYGVGEARSYERQFSFSDTIPTYYFAQSKYERVFIQGSMGSSFHVPLIDAWGETGGTVRVAQVEFNTLRVGDAAYDGLMKTFVEPAIFIRIGHPIISAELQWGCSYNVSLAAPFDYRTLYASIGAHVRIGATEQAAEAPR